MLVIYKTLDQTAVNYYFTNTRRHNGKRKIETNFRKATRTTPAAARNQKPKLVEKMARREFSGKDLCTDKVN